MEDRIKRHIWAVGSLFALTAIVAIVLKLYVTYVGIDVPMWVPAISVFIGLGLGYVYVRVWEKKVDWI